jgi:tripartite-type tricarboxylate transporter receptor subunit TctC
MVVPKATPQAIVARISKDVAKILREPATQKQMLDRGVVPDMRGPEEWTKFVHAELVKWTDVAKRANVKAD